MFRFVSSSGVVFVRHARTVQNMHTPALDETEVLYRQVGDGGNPIYFDPVQARPVHRAVFLPTSRDTDGLSFIRSRFRTEIWSAYREEQPETRFRLALLEVIGLSQLASHLKFPSWDYLQTPDSLDNQYGHPWGHCVAPGINRTDYDSDREAKMRIKEWALKVADKITHQNVIGPFEVPTDQEPYRPPTTT